MSGCGIVGNPAGIEVTEGLDRLWGIANDTIEQADKLSQQMADLIAALTPVTVDIDIESAGSLSRPFEVGAKPDPASVSFVKPSVPGVPDLGQIEYTETAEKPGAAPGSPPAMTLPDRPSGSVRDAPGPAPSVGTYPMPDAPSDEIPPIPSLRPISVPNFAPLEFPEWTGTIPSPLAETGFGNFEWTDPGYTPTVRTEVVDQIKAILGGSTGIPDLIWNMIEQRARQQLRATARQAREEAIGYWAAKGHFLSNGQLRKRVDIAAETEREGVSELVRELVVQDAKIYVERLNTALAEGIALENQLIALYNTVADRSLKVAQTIFDVRMQVARYKIDHYNALLQGVQIEAQIFDTLIRGELAKLEQTKAELEKQKLVGQLNLQELEAYKAQIAGVTARYDLFSKQVEAVVAQYDADRTRVAAFGEEVKAFQAKVQAKEAEWRGYAEAVRGEIAVQDSYRIAAEIFGQRVQAYATGVQADRARLDAQIDAAKLKLEKARAELQRTEEEIRAEQARVEARLKSKESEVEIFKAAASVEESRVRSDAQRLQVLIENQRAQMQAQIQETQLKIQEAQNKLTLQTEALKTLLGVQSSLASSAMAALNIGAQIQESASNSYSCINRYNTEL